MELETANSSSRRAAFEAHRGRLWGVAYRMLGSRADADDMVQEAYLRWHGAPTAEVRTPEAWLVTATTRLCIDRLRQLRAEREAYVGPWLPEPLVEEAPAADAATELASDLSVAFLALLERLAPEERAAFLLHDVFDSDYDEIAATLGKSESACRQIVSRARRRVREERPRVQVDPAARERLVESFMRGGASVVRFLLGVLRGARDRLALQKIVVNGETGIALRVDGRLVSVMSFATDDRQILGVYSVLNPDKLGGVPPAVRH